MALVTYIEHNGTEHKVDVANGDSVMQGAINNAIEGIVAECGGGLACATCVCFVDRCAVGGRNADAGLLAQWRQPGQPLELPDQHQ